jgi:hypothetical protein
MVIALKTLHNGYTPNRQQILDLKLLQLQTSSLLRYFRKIYKE